MSDQFLTVFMRLSAARLVLAFGDPDAQQAVRGLVDGRLDKDEADRVRTILDGVAARVASLPSPDPGDEESVEQDRDEGTQHETDPS